jgi:hypothetical protein
MKPHRILKSFPGSQHGNDHDHFEAGTVRPLSPALAEVAVKYGLAEPDEAPEEKSKGDAPANKARAAAPSNKAK